MWVWVLEAIASLETLKAEDYDAEYRIAKPDGMVRWIGDRGFLVREEQRQIYCLTEIPEDITSKKFCRSAFSIAASTRRRAALTSHFLDFIQSYGYAKY